MRRRARVDANQAEIVKALRKAGALVHVTSGVGSGFPDLVVGWGGRIWLLEVKDYRQTASKRALTPDEEAFHLCWWKHGCRVVNNVSDAMILLGVNTMGAP